MPLPPVGGDGGEAGGVIVGQYWGDEGAEDNIKLPVGGRSSSRDTRRWKRRSSETERGAKAEEEEEERKERTPPHMVRNPLAKYNRISRVVNTTDIIGTRSPHTSLERLRCWRNSNSVGLYIFLKRTGKPEEPIG